MFKRVQLLGGNLCVQGGVNRSKRGSELFAIFPARKIQAVTNQVHDACLKRGSLVRSAKGLRNSLQAIGDGDQNIFNTACLEVVEDLEPEFGALCVLDPQPQDVAAAVGQNPQRQINCLVAHNGFFSNLDSQRVKEDHRIHRFERPVLPGADLGHDGVGDRADELRAHFRAVLLGQKPLNLSYRHAARIHRDDLVIKAGEAPLVLGDEQGLKAAVSVARNLQAHRAVLGHYGLGCLAVAQIGRVLGLLAGCKTEVVA